MFLKLKIMKTDIQLIAKRKQAKKIFVAPYRKGVNYLKLLDRIKDIADELYDRSVTRALN